MEVISAFQQYRDFVGHWPSSDTLAGMLSLRQGYDSLEGLSENNLEWTLALQTIMSGGLQFAASELLGQSTQKAAGRKEMIDGLLRIEAIRERNCARYQPLAKPRRPQ